MNKLMIVGICCSLISIWGILQMALMGVFYYMESLTLFHDVEPHGDEASYSSYHDYIQLVRHSYNMAATNCLGASAAYVVTLILSYMCILRAKTKDKAEAQKLADDEAFCNVPLNYVEVIKVERKNKKELVED